MRTWSSVPRAVRGPQSVAVICVAWRMVAMSPMVGRTLPVSMPPVSGERGVPRKADPRCFYCNGRGGEQYGDRWVTCVCVNGTTEQREAVRALHAVGAHRDHTQPLDTHSGSQMALDLTKGGSSDQRARTAVGPTLSSGLPAGDTGHPHRRFCGCCSCQQARAQGAPLTHHPGWRPQDR